MLSLESYPDRLQYGDGHFTTLAVRGGAPQNWPAHRSRLEEACARLAMSPPDWQSLEDAVMKAAAQRGQGGVKVLVARAAGGRGYRPAEGPSQVWVSHFAEPAHYPLWRSQGISLALLPVILGTSPMLAGLKHCSRLEQVLAAEALARVGSDEGVLLDDDGFVVSAVSANLFWFKGAVLHTPNLARSGVSGTQRAMVMAAQPAQVVQAPLTALDEADEIFLCNALMGVVPVHTFGTRRLAAPRLTLQLRDSLE